MKHNLVLTIASLLSILLMTFHLADDVVRGMEPGGIKNLIGVLILVVWLYGTLVLAEGRSRYVIILLGSLLGSGVPVVHMTGSGLVGGKIANSNGVFLWVWTLLALGVTASFSVILSARELWRLKGAGPSSSATRTRKVRRNPELTHVDETRTTGHPRLAAPGGPLDHEAAAAEAD